MTSRWTRQGMLSIGAAVLLTVSGCGGKGTETDSAIVVPDPTVAVSSGSTAKTSTPTTSDSKPAPTPTPAVAGDAPVTKAEGWGTLKGRVVFEGDAPAGKILVPKGDPNAKDSAVCAVSEIKSERLIVDAATKGVKNVIVYIPRPTAVNPEAKSAKASAAVVFDQKKCIFEPHVLAVMTNTKIDIKSGDAVGHNVNSKVQNNAFNDAIAPNGSSSKTPVAAAKQPGIVTCDIHPWMMAYWLVLDNPYFAVTDDKGNFEIKNAPAGTQKVAVWQEATAFVTPSAGQNVDIKPSADTTQDFSIKPAQVKPEQ